MSVIFREAISADIPHIIHIGLTSRKTFLPYAPLAHTDEEIAEWVENHLFVVADIYVAEMDEKVVGFMALLTHNGMNWIDQLYMLPEAVGKGIGAQFVAMAKEKLEAPIRLYTFQENVGARRFYERHGFKPIEFGDGSGNEENCPDVLYEWGGL